MLEIFIPHCHFSLLGQTTSLRNLPVSLFSVYKQIEYVFKITALLNDERNRQCRHKTI